MSDKHKLPNFQVDKKKVESNLEELKDLLDSCVDAGMLDPDAYFHNELLDLRDEASLSHEYPELEAVISQAKILEEDIDVWLSSKGRTSIGLDWPQSI